MRVNIPAFRLPGRVLDEEIDAWVWIGGESLESSRVEYHAENVANFLTQERIERVLSAIFAEHRLAAAGYDARNYVGSWHEWSRLVPAEGEG